VETADDSRRMLRGVLTKDPAIELKAPRDIVTLNAGVALYAANVAPSMKEGIDLARQAIASGAAERKLEAFVAATKALAV
jgi:anthranilate phosphoribosyltransferase